MELVSCVEMQHLYEFTEKDEVQVLVSTNCSLVCNRNQPTPVMSFSCFHIPVTALIQKKKKEVFDVNEW
jgi:hypothetical protein